MNVKKWILASIVVFIVYEVLNYLIHSVILMGFYGSTMDIWRADMTSTMWISTVARET